MVIKFVIQAKQHTQICLAADDPHSKCLRNFFDDGQRGIGSA